MANEIPYPPVFHDWRNYDERVATGCGVASVNVEMHLSGNTWKCVELTEADACSMAASLLARAGETKLSERVLRKATALTE